MPFVDCPKEILQLAKFVFKDDNWSIWDWDLDRVYVSRDNEEYTIRMWDANEKSISWTLFKMVGNHGEEMTYGSFHFLEEK